MWILFHDDTANPHSEDAVLRESSRVNGAVTFNAQTSIDPWQITAWLGSNILKHPMIWLAVGASSMQDAIDHYQQNRGLYHEYSPINHLTADDPPLLMTYSEDMALPARDARHGIHHGIQGIRVKVRADELGVECHLLIPGLPETGQ